MPDNDKINISIIIPVYGCRNELSELLERLKRTLLSLNTVFEVILIDDMCPINSWEEITALIKYYEFVEAIKLSRNFGQHHAITAGLTLAQGEWVVVMDCDLQDRPEEIINLYNKKIEGYDVVLARRSTRKDSWFKRMSSRLFYLILGYLSDTNLDPAVANFGIYNKKVINAVLSIKESLRFFPAMVQWVGFNTTSINVTHDAREGSITSYSFKKLITLAMDVIISFSDKPLRMMIKIGFIMSLISTMYAVILIAKAVNGDIVVSGWASMMVSIWFVSGLILVMLGIVGIYVGKSFDEAKQRPIYIIDKKISGKKN